MASTDAFAPLERVVAKYRSDVHQLPSGAPPDALTALEGHLGRSLPSGIRTFLARHNGASLFRGALRIRSAAEMALASEEAPQVVLFSDGGGDVHWGWATDDDGNAVFGRWDGETLEPLHGSFVGWLAGEIALLETRVTRPEDQESLRLEADPDDAYQLVRAGERALRAGRPEEAEDLLRRATSRLGTHVLAWQRLGDALAVSDRTAARRAWLQAFRHLRLPLPWPGAPCFDPEVVRALAPAFPDAEGWERELERFLADQVRDVQSEREARVVTAAATELAASRIRRGRRSEARDVLSALLARCRMFVWSRTPWSVLLDLAALEADLGHHDEAEALLRRLRREGPPELQGRGLLLLAQIAVNRQEPWAEEILDEASGLLEEAAGLRDEAAGLRDEAAGPRDQAAGAGGSPHAELDEADEVAAAVLRVERAVRQERPEEVAGQVERARAAARRVALRPLQARVALAEADGARIANDPAAAQAACKRGLELLGEKGDPELRHRLQLRMGDLALEIGRAPEAESLYRQAAAGFAAHELPVREGWALVRLARVARDPEPLLERARGRFSEADLAAGVSAIDALRGDPGASLGWHLERATAHAAARADAQRSRPPYDRADADRPERRLGAHRLAIAACPEAVVTTLAREMDACARAMSTGRGRALDPPVVRYIAAVDLLSAHRSYSAAQVLLEHLLQRAVDGPARRALQGAIARSPNAALVDGLLSSVERPGEHPAPAVAEAAELLGLRRETAAQRALVALAAPGSNPIVRKAGIVALGRIGDRAVVDRLVPALLEPALAEQAALALLMLGDRRGVDFHGRALAEGRRDLSGSPGEIVGRYGGPSHLLLLRNTAAGDDERAIGAAQGLGLMGDPRAVSALLDRLESRNREMVQVASGALQILTGHGEDMDDPGGRTRWRLWWEQNAGRFREGTRYRDGRVFDAGLLIEKMEHPDAWVRRTAYDELVITSGRSLPFDSDGPWRVQRAHLRAWTSWWKTARMRMLAGRWYLDGEPVG